MRLVYVEYVVRCGAAPGVLALRKSFTDIKTSAISISRSVDSKPSQGRLTLCSSLLFSVKSSLNRLRR